MKQEPRALQFTHNTDRTQRSEYNLFCAIGRELCVLCVLWMQVESYTMGSFGDQLKKPPAGKGQPAL
jgi:hypothetical protein